MKKQLISTFFFFIAGLLGVSAQKNLPNVVFILADDVGYGDIGIYGGKVPTPNIDSLAREGMRFTDAHSPAALCAPSRFSLLTGSYPYRNGRPGGSWDANFSSGFEFNADRTKAGKHITVGEVLQNSGYKTAFFGKMHLGATVYDSLGNPIRDKNKLNTMDFSKGVDDALNEHGFDYWLGLLSGIQHEPYAFFENGNYKPIDPRHPATNKSTRLLKNGFYKVSDNGLSEIVEAGNIPARGDRNYDSSQAGIILTTSAENWIDEHVAEKSEQPFMLYFSSQAIHVPHTPPFDYDAEPSIVNEQVYGKTGGTTSDVLYEVDMQVGRIIKKLKEHDLLNNTIIIFTSDNGALWPRVTHYGDPDHDNNGPLRDYKASIYEGGHRVPFIASWKDSAGNYRIEPNSVSDELITNMDWVATMYELTNQNMEEDQAMDSKSLLPWLTGKSQDRFREFLLYQAGFAYDGAIREGDWVLVVDRKNEATELYNLKNDLAQEKNLIDKEEHQQLIEKLKKKFLSYNDHDNETVEPRSTIAYRKN